MVWKNKGIGKVVFAFFAFFSFVARGGEVYYYIDENGVYHFSTEKKNARYNRLLIWRDGDFTPEERYLEVKFDELIKSASELYQVDVDLIRAIIKVESDFNHKAVSPKGAQGLMQLMPETQAKFRIYDPFHPRDNIYAGVAYFKALLIKYQGNEKLALAAYNAGENAVAKYGGIPPYPETQNYVKNVLKYYRQYKEKYSGSGREIFISAKK